MICFPFYQRYISKNSLLNSCIRYYCVEYLNWNKNKKWNEFVNFVIFCSSENKSYVLNKISSLDFVGLTFSLIHMQSDWTVKVSLNACLFNFCQVSRHCISPLGRFACTQANKNQLSQHFRFPFMDVEENMKKKTLQLQSHNFNNCFMILLFHSINNKFFFLHLPHIKREKLHGSKEWLT